MEAIKRFSRAELEEIAHDQYMREFPGGGRSRLHFANVRPILGISGAEHVFSRGKIWEVPPIPFEAGARLAEIREGLTSLRGQSETPVNVGIYTELLRAAVALFPSLVRPQAKGLKRLRWRLGLHGNPWRKASEEEIGELVSFFYGSRMRSPARDPDVAGAEAKPLSI